jgi:hypothetical protein
MGHNFHTSAALQIKIQYNITILAIQEHTPWNRKFLDGKITFIERHCTSKLQILIIDKQLTAYHCETVIFQEGHIKKSQFEICLKHFVTFVPVRGIPYSIGEKIRTTHKDIEENTILREMTIIQDQMKNTIIITIKTNDIIYVFGDKQDTPDNSKKFHYCFFRIPKHPFGIVKTYEDSGLLCLIYQHLEPLESLLFLDMVQKVEDS